MNNIPRAEQSQHHTPWRVILVGRTGLDQVLRRDERVELIRARDTIDAMGELADPIDQESPVQAVVLVAASAEPGPDELGAFINGLRLIDDSVRVLRVGDDHDAYDGFVAQDAALETIIGAIERSRRPSEPVALRFVDPDAGRPPVPATQTVHPESKPEPQPEPVSNPRPRSSEEPPAPPPRHEASASGLKPEPARAVEDEVQPEEKSGAGPGVKPGVTVVVKNDSFEHRAQASFEEESELHRRVIMGDEHPALSPAPPAPRPLSFAGPHDDQPLVMAMLSGRSIIDAALDRINLRLGRGDIAFDANTHTRGVPVLVGDQIVGSLVCGDDAWGAGAGLSPLAHQSRWLATWIRLEKQQAELRRCAFTDTLTGAWNRRYFSRFLDAAIEQARTARQPLTVMLFDIDEFKHYNDAYGHAAGDEILVETVRLLKSVIRPSDRVCRVGGDEFVVIFYEPQGPRASDSKPLESVYQIARRFQTQICKHRFPKLGHEAMGTLTVSAGLASFPWDGHDARSLLEQADQLAMESKRQGKNAITLGPGAESVCHAKR